MSSKKGIMGANSSLFEKTYSLELDGKEVKRERLTVFDLIIALCAYVFQNYLW